MTNVVYPASATEQDPGKGFKPPARGRLEMNPLCHALVGDPPPPKRIVG